MTKVAPARAEDPVVFVIDDDPSMREALRSLFQSVGWRVELFGSAPEFMQSTRPDGPACLVLDIRLPRLSGLEFQTELTDANIELPIIFITGHGDIPMSVKAMKAGAVDFLTKPFRDQELLDAQMPGMSGFELQQSLIAKGCKIPVIFISAFPGERLKTKTLAPDPVSFLSKTFDTKTLVECLEKALRETGSGACC